MRQRLPCGARAAAGRHGPRASILTGLVLLAVGAFGLSIATLGRSFGILGPLLALLGFGAGLVAPPMNAEILASVEPSLAGIGSGVLNAGRQIGTAFGVAMLGAGMLYLAAAAVVVLGRPAASTVRFRPRGRLPSIDLAR